MQTTNQYIKYTYNGTDYASLYDLHKSAMPNVSFPEDITDAQLSALGITKTTVTETVNYNCYCTIGSSSPTYVPTTETHTLGTNEVLMSTDQAISNAVAKEDGTWVTPPSEYTVYTCTDGKLTVDVNATYNAVSIDYAEDINENREALFSAEYGHSVGTTTDEEYASIKTAIFAQYTSLMSTISAVKEAAIS